MKMNSCNFVGRLTDDPELKTTPEGVSVCNFCLAVSRPNIKDITDFIYFVAWRQKAEYLTHYGHKGDLVSVTGCLTMRKYDDRDGNRRTVYEVVCKELSLHTPKRSHEEKEEAQEEDTSETSYAGDLPF